MWRKLPAIVSLRATLTRKGNCTEEYDESEQFNMIFITMETLSLSDRVLFRAEGTLYEAQTLLEK